MQRQRGAPGCAASRISTSSRALRAEAWAGVTATVIFACGMASAVSSAVTCVGEPGRGRRPGRGELPGQVGDGRRELGFLGGQRPILSSSLSSSARRARRPTLAQAAPRPGRRPAVRLPCAAP